MSLPRGQQRDAWFTVHVIYLSPTEMPCLYYLYDYSPNLLGTEETTKGRQKMDYASMQTLGLSTTVIYLEQTPFITISQLKESA